ncbi:hypothetical protein SporoP17a_11985 [Sporosarcina ureae]|nr:hypothetical protein SporoP17a_11985 [Sporosarcina ureae]
MLCLNLFKFEIDYKLNFNAQQNVSSTRLARDWRVGGTTPRGSARQERQPKELATGWLAVDPQESVPSEAPIPTRTARQPIPEQPTNYHIQLLLIQKNGHFITILIEFCNSLNKRFISWS